MARLPHWAKVAHNLDSHPKIRKAGNLGRQVFEYALRRNSDPSNTMGPGRVALDYFEPRYLTEQLMLPASKRAIEGLEAAIGARLLRRTDSAIELVGWEDEWGKGPLTEAERKAIQRSRAKAMSGHCPDGPVTDRDASGQSRTQRKTERREEKEEREKGEPERGSAPVTPPAAPVARAKATKAKPTDHTEAELASVRLVLDRLSERSGVRYQGSKEHTRLIVARLRDGVTEWDLRRVIGYCADRLGWQDKPEMRPFLRPETLFGPQTLQKYLDPARTWAPGSEPTDDPVASGEAAESAGPKLRLVQEADERPDSYARHNDGGLFDFSNDPEQEPEWMTK
jgi:uncharacterized phage protein (TIGR02220 family)